MTIRLLATLLLFGALAGCKSVDGVYLPACMAYAGDRFELKDGAVVWDKFTDQIRVDDSGEPIDPFPDYPQTGSYGLDGDVLTIVIEGAGTAERFHLHRDNGRLLLLTAAQQRAWESGGRYDDCVLERTTEQ